MVKEITAWRTDDGKVWEDLDEAIAHENHNALREDLEKILWEHGYSNMGPDRAVNIILENLSDFRHILRDRR